MKCPHCAVSFHEHWQSDRIFWGQNFTRWEWQATHCPACGEFILRAKGNGGVLVPIFPRDVSRSPISLHVPTNIAGDYKEACEVLSISAKASAALSRRCLQNMLSANGFSGRDLAGQIDQFLQDAKLPSDVRITVDAVRNFGNFSAHPITDITSLQIIDVEPEEAEWCLEILESLFDHFYEKPALANAKKAALDAKLAAAGKPVSKG